MAKKRRSIATRWIEKDLLNFPPAWRAPPNARALLVVRLPNGRFDAIFGGSGGSDGQETTRHLCIEADLTAHQVHMLHEVLSEPAQDLAWHGKAAQALHLAGISLENIAGVMGLANRSAASRLVRLGSRPAWSKRHLGKIHHGHLKYLTSLDDATFAKWCETIAARRLSVARVGAALKSEGESVSEESANADIAAYSQLLAQVVGSEVRLEWPSESSRRRLRIAWFTIEDLKGVLEKLAQGSSQGAIRDARTQRRWLEFPVTDSDELDALVGHLTAEGARQ